MNAITIITGRRSGAGHVLALLNSLDSVAVRADLLLDPNADIAAEVEAAEAEALAAGKELLILRATPALPRELMEGALLDRPGMRAIFVVRRQVDAYVSLAKATALGAWRDTDLTNVKVKLDAAQFAEWLDAQDEWHRHWKAWLERRAFPAPVLRYETGIVDVPGDTVLRRFASAASQLGITIRVPPGLAPAGLTKQDKQRTVAFKVRNWPDFSRGLGERGIEKRAFGYPI
jgi:hypothetical protein